MQSDSFPPKLTKFIELAPARCQDCGAILPPITYRRCDPCQKEAVKVAVILRELMRACKIGPYAGTA